jgi:3-deoxy-manno-octulosonate cytidylyltransferase (CMP-KDO synthetase)
MKIIGIIPARMGSSRFPGKPLARILGISMIEHVFQRSAASTRLTDLYVATCDGEIYAEVESFGGKAVMTGSQHVRATERIAEASTKLDADIVVMIQGDEPMITPEMIDAAVQPMLENPDVTCVNLIRKIETEQEFQNPNIIKVVMDRQRRALYFSRHPIPTTDQRSFDQQDLFKQVCVIPFRSKLLQNYVSLEPTELEKAESVDMLRLLEHGYPVHLVETAVRIQSVDTPEDLELVESLLADDPLCLRYGSFARRSDQT